MVYFVRDHPGAAELTVPWRAEVARRLGIDPGRADRVIVGLGFEAAPDDPPPTVLPPWPDFLAAYPVDMREEVLERLRANEPETYRSYAARWRALAIRS